jgi:hypothetical protein
MELEKALKQLNTHIKKIPVIYHINRDKGVVVAKLDTEKGADWLNGLWGRYMQVGSILNNGGYYIEANVRLSFIAIDIEDKRVWQARGIAKCSPEDTYDEKIGKLIAKKKLQDKFYHLLYSVFVKKHNSLVDYLKANLQVVNYFTFKGLKNAKDIFLIGGGSEKEWQETINSAKGTCEALK